jgi:hypothetical protein
MRSKAVATLVAAFLATICVAGSVSAAKPPPKVLTADICDKSGSGFQVFWIRYSYSGFKHAQAAGYSIETPEGVFEGTFGLAEDPESGSAVMAFSWGGVVVGSEATAMRATLYASSPNNTVGESAWIPITDNSIGGLTNNGWPPC